MLVVEHGLKLKLDTILFLVERVAPLGSLTKETTKELQMEQATKKCTNPECNKIKPITDFYYRKDTSKYRDECKECILASRKIYRDNNNCEINLRNKKRYQNNKEEYAKRAKNYRNKNKEKISTIGKDYYKKNKKEIQKKRSKDRNENLEETRKKDREYRLKNKDRINAREKITRQSKRCKETKLLHNRKRRALKISTADGTITKESLQELLQMQNNKCYWCSCVLDDTKHLDHYIPLSKGGTHSIYNVVWSCSNCNLTKGATPPDTLILI